MFTKLVSGNDLRGYGGELLRKGACKLIEKLALSSVLIKETEVLDAFWDIIFTTIPHTEPNVQVNVLVNSLVICHHTVKAVKAASLKSDNDAQLYTK